MKNNDRKTEKARNLCMEVKNLANKYSLPFFFVTDGASINSNNGCDAVKQARQCHEDWEIRNGYDPKHNWNLSDKNAD